MLETTVSAAEQAAEIQFWQNLQSGTAITLIIVTIIAIIILGLRLYIGINRMKRELKKIKEEKKERKAAKKNKE